jgi:hypothetical protein
MSSDRLIYLPLGGAGEIGMNAYVYGYGPKGKERLIVVDLGVTFPNMDTSPGVDLILPDITWLKDVVTRLRPSLSPMATKTTLAQWVICGAIWAHPSMRVPLPRIWRAIKWPITDIQRPP